MMVLRHRRLLRMRARSVFAFVKDRLAMERARFRGDSRTAAAQVCVLRVTTHAEQPPSKRLVDEALRALTGSRRRASLCVTFLLQRLSKAKSWVVAVKCLTLVHKALQHGDFIYQEQLLSLYLKRGGQNPFKFSQFRDKTSFLAWQASSWIQWYAAYLEALTRASSIYFSGKPISGLQSGALMERLLFLEELVCEMSGCPLEDDQSAGHALIADAFSHVVKDYIATQPEIRGHVQEICKRLGEFTGSQITDLMCLREVLSRDCQGLGKLIKVAISRNLLSRKGGFDQLRFTNDELIRTNEALLQSASMSAVNASNRQRLTEEDALSRFGLR